MEITYNKLTFDEFCVAKMIEPNDEASRLYGRYEKAVIEARLSKTKKYMAEVDGLVDICKSIYNNPEKYSKKAVREAKAEAARLRRDMKTNVWIDPPFRQQVRDGIVYVAIVDMDTKAVEI